DVAEFNELFINVKSSRTIKGVIEDGKIIVKYEGFNDLSFLENLVDVWSDENNAGFVTSFENSGTVMQTISIDTSDSDIADNFNWDYLTSNFRIS
ncbi:MAG: hypothetical protein ABH828_02495, partial [archaeon]